MAKKLLNLWAETGANIIDDDTGSTLELINTSSGYALQANNTGTAPAINAIQGAIGNSTLAAIRAVQSAASGVFLDFQGGVLSTASINMAASKVVGAVRVHFTGVGGDGFGYIPIMTGVS